MYLLLTTCVGLVMGQPTGLPEPIPLVAAESWPIRHPTHHVQGLCMDQEHFWISSVDKKSKSGWIFLVDRRSGTVMKEREITRGEQYHPGGMQRVGDALWVPVAEYKPQSTSTMLCLHPMTLETARSFPFDDHLGGVAVTGDGTLIAVNWDCKTFYELSTGGVLMGQKPNPTGVAYQDIKWREGKLWGTGAVGLLKLNSGVVDVIDPATWSLEARYKLVGKTADGGNNFGREGFDLDGNNLYLLPEDGPHTTVHRFPLPGE